MSKEKLVPKLRFKGFRNLWYKSKLDSVANIYDNLRIPVTASDRISGEIPYYGANGIQDYVDGFTHNGEYILLAEDGANDLNNYPVHYVNGKVWVNNHAHVLQGNEDVLNNYFFMYRLKSINMEPYLVGGGRAKLNANIMLNIKLTIPFIKEQNKIGSFFKKLDQMIQLQQAKVNKVKDIKSAYLAEMFPKEGEKYPKKRFEGFTEPWQQVEVQEIFRITRGYVLSATKVTEYPTKEMKYPVYSSQTKKDGLMGYYDEYLYENAITWTTDGANAGTVSYRTGKFYCTNVSGVLISNEGYANKMIAEELNKRAWKHVSKVGNPKLMNNIMAEIVISIPQSIKEQKKISQFLINLDNQISIEEEKLEKLEKLKQAYLNDMFV